MLVEINLLPKKEAKNIGFIMILSILAGLIVVATAVYIVEIYITKNSISSVSSSITQTNKMIESLQKKQGSAASENSAVQLQSAIDWAAKNRIETIPVIHEFASLLPERGFIQTFTYQGTGTVSLTVQFDTENEAAAYLNNLNHSSLVESVSLTSLSVANSNANSNSGNTAGAQTNSGNIASNQGSVSAGTTGDSNSIGTPNSSNAPNTNTGAAGTNVQNNDLQRYIGQFAIQLNQAAVNKAADTNKTGANAAEGVAGS